MTAGPWVKLDTVTRTRLAQRAKERRQSLGLSCREVGETTGMSCESVVQWEKLLPQGRMRDAKWEAVLQVPPGWLRDAGIPTPALAEPAFELAEPCQLTIARFIHAYCVWHATRKPSSRTSSYAALGDRERRIVAILVRRYGGEGEERATLQAIADDLGLTRERVRQIEAKAAALFGPVCVPADLSGRLRAALAPCLPCPVSQLPPAALELLGPGQSLEGADRFFREVLGERLVSIEARPGTPVQHEKVVVDENRPDDALMRAVRAESLAMIRQAGAAHVYFVAGAVAAQGLAATPNQVASCARMFVGFEWLIEDEGWFWYGTGPDNRAKSTALKILSAASRAVDIEELYGAMARARFTRPGERAGPASVCAPMPVLQVLLGRFSEIRQSHQNDFRLAPGYAADARSRLSPSEAMVCESLERHGGVASRRSLVDDLVRSGRIERITLNMNLMSSPVFRRHDRGIWTITGYSFSHEALRRAQEERSPREAVDGWYEFEVTIPPSAFERGDWFVPAAARPHLTPGDYAIVGLEGSARYMINAVGGPYLKRFARLVANRGFDVGVPCSFGISATERLLRLQRVATHLTATPRAVP